MWIVRGQNQPTQLNDEKRTYLLAINSLKARLRCAECTLPLLQTREEPQRSGLELLILLLRCRQIAPFQRGGATKCDWWGKEPMAALERPSNWAAVSRREHEEGAGQRLPSPQWKPRGAGLILFGAPIGEREGGYSSLIGAGMGRGCHFASPINAEKGGGGNEPPNSGAEGRGSVFCQSGGRAERRREAAGRGAGRSRRCRLPHNAPATPSRSRAAPSAPRGEGRALCQKRRSSPLCHDTTRAAAGPRRWHRSLPSPQETRPQSPPALPRPGMARRSLPPLPWRDRAAASRRSPASAGHAAARPHRCPPPRPGPAGPRDGPRELIRPGGTPRRMSHVGSPVRAYDFLLKFLLVGDSDVGKGEILASLQDGASESPYGSHTGKLNPPLVPRARGLCPAPTTLYTSALGPSRDPPAGAASFLGWEMSTAGSAAENNHFCRFLIRFGAPR